MFTSYKHSWKPIYINCWRRNGSAMTTYVTFSTKSCVDWNTFTQPMYCIVIWNQVIYCWIQHVIWRFASNLSKLFCYYFGHKFHFISFFILRFVISVWLVSLILTMIIQVFSPNMLLLGGIGHQKSCWIPRYYLQIDITTFHYEFLLSTHYYSYSLKQGYTKSIDIWSVGCILAGNNASTICRLNFECVFVNF